MNGYVENKSNMWRHAMKRSIAPGERVPLASLYEQYGTRHNLSPDGEFIEWLKSVKLRDGLIWRICYIPPNEEERVYDDDTKEPVIEVEVINEAEEVKPPEKVKRMPKASEMDVTDIAMLSVRKAREALPKIHDINILKCALKEANKLTGKDTLCKLIRKRVDDIEIGL